MEINVGKRRRGQVKKISVKEQEKKAEEKSTSQVKRMKEGINVTTVWSKMTWESCTVKIFQLKYNGNKTQRIKAAKT